MGAFIFLIACGQGSNQESNQESTQAVNDPTPKINTDKNKDGSLMFATYGCFACHSLDGSIMYGPPLNDLFMKEVTVVRKGKEETIVADREYLSKAITDPDYERVFGYQNKLMPKPVIPEDVVETLIDYLIEMGEEEGEGEEE